MAQDLKEMLKKVLASEGKKKFFFAYGLGKRNDGKGDGELAVRAKKPKKTEIEEELDDCKDVYEGVCWVGSGPEANGTVYFQAKGKKLSSMIMTKMTQTAKHTVGTQYDFQMPSPEEEARAEKLGEGEEDKTSSTAPPTPPGTVPPPPPPPPSPEALRFVTRLKALAPVMQKAEATGTEAAKEAKLQIAEANKLYVAKQYEQANAALDQVENLVKLAFAPPTTGSTGSPAAARFVTRLKALAPVMQKAEATGTEPAKAAKLQIAEANKLYVAKEYDQANAALDKAEALIKQAFAGAGQQTSPKESKPGAGPFVSLQAARVQWNQAHSTVESQLNTLKKAIVDHCQAVNENPESETEIDMGELNGNVDLIFNILKAMKEGLMDKLDEGLNASDPTMRSAKYAEAKSAAKEFTNYLNGDPLLATIDNTGFAATTIRATIAGALEKMASQLA